MREMFTLCADDLVVGLGFPTTLAFMCTDVIDVDSGDADNDDDDGKCDDVEKAAVAPRPRPRPRAWH